MISPPQSPPEWARIAAKLPHVMSNSSLLSPLLSLLSWLMFTSEQKDNPDKFSVKSLASHARCEVDLSWQVAGRFISKNCRKQSSSSIYSCIKWLFTMNTADQIQLSNNTNFVLPLLFITNDKVSLSARLCLLEG